MKKRLAVILSIFILTVIVFPSLTALAQPAKIPHENPDAVTSSLDKITLLVNYGRAVFTASDQEYTDALEVLEELRKIELPDEYRNIIDRYNGLCQQLFTTLDSLDITLDEALNLIESNNINEAKSKLDEAEIYLEDATTMLDDVNLTMDAMRQRFGTVAPSIPDELREADERLKDSMEQLQQLFDMLAELRESLNESYNEIKGLTPTSITLEISPTSAYTGDTVNARGLLQSHEEPLPGRSIIIMLDEDTFISVTSQEDGSYNGNFTLPYEYEETMKAVAVYEPRGNDTDRYLGCQSQQVTLNTRFHATQLKLSTPDIIYPGIPFNISGEIISGANEPMRTVEVTLDDIQIMETTVAGQFNLELSPPEDITTGQRALIIEVAPQERFAGVSERRSITVTLMPLEIDMETPGLTFLPRSIQLSGRVRSERGPTSGASVNISVNNSSATATTASDGSFTATLDIPLDFSLMGQRELSVNVEPLEPWAGDSAVKKQLFIINPVFTSLTLLALLTLAFIVLRRRRTADEKEAPQEEAIRSPAFITPEVPAIKLTGIKGKIISAYRAGLAIIEKIAGVKMTPDKTLREFLATAVKLLPRIAKPLTELTTLAERALYSNQNPPRKTASLAERMTDDIKKELRRGA